ncbi:MAG: STAS domain-containing protein [Candidatus Margulisiibacteriota bacterium]
MLEFSIETEQKNAIPVLRIKGEIDIYTCPRLHDALKVALDGGADLIVLDLESVAYIDSTGLGTIAQTAHTLSKSGGSVTIVCSNPQVKRIFDISGLSKKNVRLVKEEAMAFG